MRLSVGFPTLVLSAIGFAAVAGLGSAYWAIRSGPRFESVQAGPWIAEPVASTSEADPYALARRLRRGVVAPLAFESLAFSAEVDETGAPLQGHCDYRIQGPQPPARSWTVTASSRGGGLFETPTRRHGFTSAEIVRLGTDDVVISVSARARPGNWLPIRERPFQLTLRLYDTAVGAGFGATQLQFPRIVRERCR